MVAALHKRPEKSGRLFCFMISRKNGISMRFLCSTAIIHRGVLTSSPPLGSFPHHYTYRSGLVRLILFLIFLYALLNSASGQLLPLHTYTQRDGLLSGNIRLLHQDRRGFIWIGSSEGLTVYDGARFRSFSMSDGLPYTEIYAIAEDSTGTIWLATLNGLRRFSGGRFEIVWPETSISGADYVHTVMVAPDGAVWFAGRRGLFRLQKGVVSRQAFIEGVPKTPSLACTPDGVVWAAVDDRLWRCSQTEGEPAVSFPLSAGKGSIVEVRGSSDSTVWILKGDGTLAQYRHGGLIGARARVITDPRFFLDDGRGYVWVGGGDGISRIRKDEFQTAPIARFDARHGLPQNLIVSGLADHEGTLWFGCNNEGLAKLTSTHLTTIPLPFQYRVHNNAGAVVDESGHLWVTSTDGVMELFRNQSGEWQRESHRIASEPVRFIQIDRRGRLWMGIRGKGLICYSVSKRSQSATTLSRVLALHIGKELPRGDLFAVAFDRANRMWFSLPGTGVGLFDLGRMRVERFYAEQEVPVLGSVRAILIDRNDNVWMGDFWRGLAVLSDSAGEFAIRQYTMKDGLPNDGIRALYEASDGRIWIGTRYGGVVVFDGGSFRTIAMEHGLSSNAVWSFTEDPMGSIWAGTSAGLQAIRPGTLAPERFMADLAEPGIASTGLLADGTLWGVSNNRLMLVELQDSPAPIPPPIHLQRAFVNESPVPLNETLALHYDQNNCRLEFVGLSFRDEKAVRYTYRLIGLDDQWREPTALREVTYASLAPGEYTFEVKAISGDGVQSTLPARLSFSIAPPFWSRWWFIVGAVLALSGVVATVVRARVRRLLEIERIRTGIATDLHDDIGSGLTRIAILSEIASRQMTTAGGEQPVPAGGEGALLTSLEKMGSFARELHDAMSDVVWSIDPKHDTIGDVARRLYEFAREISLEQEINLAYAVDEYLKALRLAPDLLRAVLLIGKEALANAARYAQCSRLVVAISVVEGEIQLVVEDNGKGFRMEELGRVNGLANMKRRAEKAGGSLTVDSAPRQGTRIEARIPTRKT